jgi:TatD DNase family protein
VIDTHCHLNFDSFDADRDEVVARAAAVGVDRIINPAVDTPTAEAAVALAHRYSGVFAAVGVHPNSTLSWSPEVADAIRHLARSEKVVAIGEIGLDYHWDYSPRSVQIPAFEAQLELASSLNLPVIIHNRESDEDVMRILEAWAAGLEGDLAQRPGVMHSFSGTPGIAERALAAGFYIGFTGPITYKNADLTRRIAASVPLDRLLVETDAPYLTPIPYRGKRNEPAYIPLVVERLASVKRMSADEMGVVTTRNAERLFGLPAQ